MTAPVTPLIGDLGTPELLIILAVVILLFGSSKLPELARGSGRALRIFKAETKGLLDDDEEAKPPGVQGATPVAPGPAAGPAPATPTVATAAAKAEYEARRRELAARQAELDAEAARLRGEAPTA